MGRAIGLVDVQLPASALLAGIRFWPFDQRLAAVADELGVAGEPEA